MRRYYWINIVTPKRLELVSGAYNPTDAAITAVKLAKIYGYIIRIEPGVSF